MDTSRDSVFEELANAVTHGIGAGLSIAGLIVLVVMAVAAGSPLAIVSVSIYGGSLVLLYLASTLYHSIHHEGARPVLRAVDHCAIFLLIAGTYTPFTLLVLREDLGWWLLGAIWSLAFVGIVLRLRSARFHIAAIPLFLAMGWLIVPWIDEVFAAIGPAGGRLLVAGGLAYTAGVAFYLWRRLPYNHAVWHLFVVGGSVCHFLAVALYAMPSPA